MGGSVPDTPIVVVASVSYLQGFVLDIWFLCKDRIREVIQTKAILISFQTEGTGRRKMATPSSTYFKVALLVECHQEIVSVLVVGNKIFKVNGTFPIAVFVTEVAIVAICSICSIHVCSDGVVVEVAVVSDYGDDG